MLRAPLAAALLLALAPGPRSTAPAVPAAERRSLGSFMILDHMRLALTEERDYVYLGYWVDGSAKMAYKARFRPLEQLTRRGWEALEA